MGWDNKPLVVFTPAQETYVRARYAAGGLLKDMAAVLRLPEEGFRRRFHRLGLSRPDRSKIVKDSGPWGGMEPRLRELWATPAPARDIAEMLSKEFGIKVNRNMILGKARRMELPPRAMASPKKSVETSAGELGAPAKGPALKPPIPLPVREPVTFANGVDIWGLRENSCRWPDAQHGIAIVYCGEPVEPGQRVCFCAAHRKLAFLPSRAA